MFAYDLCLHLGILHPDYLLASLTNRQFQGWEAYQEQRGAIGEIRNDIRSEAMQQRMMHRLFGENTDNVPLPLWPYWQPDNTVELFEKAMNTERELISDGKGGHVWRQPSEH